MIATAYALAKYIKAELWISIFDTNYGQIDEYNERKFFGEKRNFVLDYFDIRFT